MPELPEVETVRSDLDKILPGRLIRQVKVNWSKIERGGSLTRQLKAKEISKISRQAKLLIIEFKDWDKVVFVHLKMTGQLFYEDGKKMVAGGHDEASWRAEKEEEELVSKNKHTHIEVKLTGGGELLFNDVRKFGYWEIADVKRRQEVLAKYGPEPEKLTSEYLWPILKRRKTSIKAVLLDQKVVAGLGNIYVDEVLLAAGVRPTRRADRITRKETERLVMQIQRVIAQAIDERGTTFNNYRDGQGRKGGYLKMLQVYGREGEDCRQCGRSVIKKIRVAQRGTHFCPKCQK